MHPKHLQIADFIYSLPIDKIATEPLTQRDGSKLLLYKNGVITESIFNNIASYLPENSLLVFNNSKVIEARLLFKKESGGTIEIFVLEAYKMDVSTAMQMQAGIECLCLVGGAKKWKSEPLVLTLKNDSDSLVPPTLTAHLIEKKGESFLVRFEWLPAVKTFAEVLHLLGQMPIPPYLNRPSNEGDKVRYQTIYAKADGSVAAPTAGLHFTENVMENLHEKGIVAAYATLHVGAGTFKPVKSKTIEGHNMHAEYLDVDAAFIKQLIKFEKVIAVGTTSLRTIESLYWMGVKTYLQPTIKVKELEIKQWEIYDSLMVQTVSKTAALESLIDWIKRNEIQRLIIQTQILIAPDCPIKVANGIITNFHQPQSTLLLLVAALIGDQWKNMYEYALKNDFRFLSYGDSSYIDFR